MVKNFFYEEKEIRKIFAIDFFLYFANFLQITVLSVYMNEILKLPFKEIGFLIGIPALVACFFGISSYFFYRLVGTFNSIVICIAIDCILAITLIAKGNFYFIIFASILKGISTCIFMPIFKNLYVVKLQKEKNRAMIFKIKYILICTSAVFAPFIANKIYAISKTGVFIIVLLINISSILFFYKNKTFYSTIKVDIAKNNKSFKNIFKKKSFFLFLLGIILSLAVFSQFEGTFPLTQKIARVEKFSLLLILNSIFGIIFQLIIIKHLKNIRTINQLLIGSLFFSISFIFFYISNETLLFLIIAILFFTVGETLILPNIEIFISELSSDEDRVLLYSFSEFKRLGFFLGPFLSGYLINIYNSSIMLTREEFEKKIFEKEGIIIEIMTADDNIKFLDYQCLRTKVTTMNVFEFLEHLKKYIIGECELYFKFYINSN